MPLNLFYTMVQKSQKWPKTQIKGVGSCLNQHKKDKKSFSSKQIFMEGKRQEHAKPNQFSWSVNKGHAPRCEVASLLYLTL